MKCSSKIRDVYFLSDFVVLLIAIPITAADKTDAATQPTGEAGQAKVTADATTIQRLSLASSLIHYDRK
jgi:hypothetical protein